MKIQASARKKIEKIVERYKGMNTPQMLILSDIQKEFGYIPLDVQELLAELLNIPVAEIYGVVSFYSFFTTEPKGKNVIGVCLGTACYVKGSAEVLSKIESTLNIKSGSTTPDGEFTIDVLRCVGACGLAPALVINGKVFPKATPADIDKIIADCRQGAY
jgi:NADH:ubiquinone oxidoreductase subunit E